MKWTRAMHQVAFVVHAAGVVITAYAAWAVHESFGLLTGWCCA